MTWRGASQAFSSYEMYQMLGAIVYPYRTCPVQICGHAGSNIGRVAGRDLLGAVTLGAIDPFPILLVIDSKLVCSTDFHSLHGQGCRGSRGCSRETYPESYITEYTSVRRLCVGKVWGLTSPRAGVFIVRDVPNAGNAFRRDVAGRLSAPKLQQPVLPCPASHDILP